MTTPTGESQRQKTQRRFRISRDSILFGVGILGIIYQTVIVDFDRPTLLLVFAAMCGLPAFLAVDERWRGTERRKPPPADPVTPEPPVGPS